MDFSDPISAVIPSVDGRVLAVLARSGLPLTGLQAANLAGASPERVRQVLLRLRDDGLVLANRAGASVLYEANRRHVLWPGVATLVTTADSALFLVKNRIRDTLLDMKITTADVTVAIFGSVARGQAHRSSDVDMFVVAPDETPSDDLEHLVATVADTVNDATGNECNVLIFTRSRFDSLIREEDSLIRSIAADADLVCGPDFRRRLTGGPWDEPAR